MVYFNYDQNISERMYCMKLFHLSDLHLGKRVSEISLIDDQKHILAFILEKVCKEKPDAVMIAGDVYDRVVPSEEAVMLFNDFLCGLVDAGTTVLITSGNHDSTERLSFGSKLMRRENVYISANFRKENYKECLKPIMLQDDFGDVYFYILPFLTPGIVKNARGCEISNWTDAMGDVIKDMNIDTSARNVFIGHQFVQGGVICESESAFVGEAERVDPSVFAPFDYVALGHLHGPQNIADNIRYCGSPLKYSFSEEKHKKSITVLELKEKGNKVITEIPLNKPLHDWRTVNIGNFGSQTYEQTNAIRSDDYICAVLTDEDYIVDAMNKLREFFPHIMKMRYDNAQTRKRDNVSQIINNVKELTPMEVFENFYKNRRNGQELTEEQRAIVKEIFESEEEE